MTNDAVIRDAVLADLPALLRLFDVIQGWHAGAHPGRFFARPDRAGVRAMFEAHVAADDQVLRISEDGAGYVMAEILPGGRVALWARGADISYRPHSSPARGPAPGLGDTAFGRCRGLCPAAWRGLPVAGYLGRATTQARHCLNARALPPCTGT